MIYGSKFRTDIPHLRVKDKNLNVIDKGKNKTLKKENIHVKQNFF